MPSLAPCVLQRLYLAKQHILFHYKAPEWDGHCTQAGNVPEPEMFRTFNMGIGMVAVVGKDSVDAALAADVGAFVLGDIVPGEGVLLV